eukprot:2388524-Prymnesium_polylepis.1
MWPWDPRRLMRLAQPVSTLLRTSTSFLPDCDRQKQKDLRSATAITVSLRDAPDSHCGEDCNLGGTKMRQKSK